MFAFLSLLLIDYFLQKNELDHYLNLIVFY